MLKGRCLGWLMVVTVLCSLSLSFTACSGERGRFRLEGRLRNLNQAEFWVYSTDGGLTGIDTIHVRDSRFAYELDVNAPTTLVIIFPNYSEQPVFAEPGGKVTIKGDATHLKEITIKGTDDNELMTRLRMELSRQTPPEIPGTVKAFIKEHPSSPVSIYLLRRYFLLSRQPDYQTARSLTNLMLKENPDNGQLIVLKKQLARLQGGAMKSRLPKFSATDVKGRKVTESNLKSKLNVVSVWSSWSYWSQDVQHRLKRLKEQYADQLAVLCICLDGDINLCKQRIKNDSLRWPTVCDGKMWDSPLLSTFGLADVPSNLLYDDKGIVIARNLSAQALDDEIKKRLKPNN